MTLNDFFLPLNLIVSVQLLYFILAFDIIGFSFRTHITRFSEDKSNDDFFRLIDWWWGACLFTLGVFILHIFFPLHRELVYGVSLILLAFSFPTYFRFRGVSSLFSEITGSIKKYWLALIPISLLLKPIYFRLSIPPTIWDELAYHAWSPARIIFEQHWVFDIERFTNATYEMFPRTWETLMISLFAATHSYAVGKFFQVFLVVCVALIIARILTKISDGSNIAGIVWLLSILFIGRGLLYEASTAYIDVGSSAALILVVAFAWTWSQKKTQSNWLMLVASVGAAMSTKYSVIPAIIAVGIMLSFQTILVLKKRFSIPKNWTKLLLLTFIVWIAVGGFWYLKNLLISGNPFWPFFNYALGIKECCDGRMIIEGWGYTQFSYENRWPILDTIFGERKIQWWIGSFVVVSAVSLLQRKFNKSLKFMFFLLSLAALEVALSFRNGLFTPRFYQHWQFYKYLWLIIPISLLPAFDIRLAIKFFKESKKKLVKLKVLKDIVKLLTIALPLIWLVLSVRMLSESIKPSVFSDIIGVTEFEFNDNDRWKIREKMNTLDWIHPTFPHSFPMIEWCSDTKDGHQDIYVGEVETTLGHYSLSKVYLARCELRFIIGSPNETADELLDRMNSEIPNFTYTSASNCDQSTESDPSGANTVFVCRGEEFLPQLYRFPK